MTCSASGTSFLGVPPVRRDLPVAEHLSFVAADVSARGMITQANTRV